MTRKEIEKVLQTKDQTILSFPNRGPWGSSSYRGNCSGWIQAFLIWKYKINHFAELFSGSGTGYDVCKDMGISYVGADLNPNPVRPGILNVNAITDEVPDQFRNADMIFMHPPYSNICNINWAGKAYPDPTNELVKSDLGAMSWNQFIKTLNEIIMKYYVSMKPGAYMGILMGDVRRSGIGFKSMITDIVKPGLPIQLMIKEQHNTVSERNNINYTHKNFVPLNHEYLYVLQKVIESFFINFQLPTDFKVDIRKSKKATWKDIIFNVFLQEKNKGFSLQEIYLLLSGNKRFQEAKFPKEKVRQTLYLSKNLFTERNGLWYAVA